MTLTRRALIKAATAAVVGIRALPARVRRAYGSGRYGAGTYGGRR